MGSITSGSPFRARRDRRNHNGHLCAACRSNCACLGRIEIALDARARVRTPGDQLHNSRRHGLQGCGRDRLDPGRRSLAIESTLAPSAISPDRVSARQAVAVARDWNQPEGWIAYEISARLVSR